MLNPSMNRWMGGALIALALVSTQAVRADDKAVNLIVKPKVGAVTKYKSTIKATVMGMEINIETSEKMTIKEVKDNGDITVLTESLGGKMSVNGMEQDQPPTPPTTITRDKLGKLVDYKSEDQPGSPFSPEVQKLMVSISDTMLTDKDVKEGDTWDTEVDNPASKENKAKIKTTFLGIEKVDGVDCWKVKQSAEAIAGMNAEKMSYDATTWTNPKTGQPQKVEAKIKDVPTQFGPITFDMTMAVVKNDKPADAKKDDKQK